MADDGKSWGVESKLPAGVSAAISDGSGGVTYVLDPFLRNMKWEGVSVDSSDFKKLSPGERLYRQSLAFLHTAISQCREAGEDPATVEWSHASVCYYCLHLATELFLKACVLEASSGTPKLSHNVADLLRTYEKLLPSDEYHFETPWSLSARDLKEILGHEVYDGVDRTPDQLYRYGMGKGMMPSTGTQFFTPGYLYNYMTHLESKWTLVWSRIQPKTET